MDEKETPHTDRDPYEPTTTHAGWGAGSPRLRITSDAGRFVHDLTDDVTRLGSAAGGEVVLAGADPLHATIEHDERDEFVLTLHGPGELSANPESAATHDGERTVTLRTGARFTTGPWTVVYMRDEFADHGRPFGGRQGGEGEHQRPQPERPDYVADGEGRPSPEATG